MAALGSAFAAPRVFGAKTAMRGTALQCSTARVVAPVACSSLVVEASRVCDLTGKKANNGYNVTFSHKRNKKLQQVNLQYKKVYWPEGQRWVKLRISTKAIKTVEKKGLQTMADEAGIDLWKLPYEDARPQRKEWLAQQPMQPPMAKNPRAMKNAEKLAASRKTPLVARYVHSKIAYVRAEAHQPPFTAPPSTMGERYVQLAPPRGDGHHPGPFNHRPANDIARTLYVGNLRYDTEEVVVRRWFEVYGDVLAVKLIRDPNSKRSKGFGFVTFTSERDARDALNDAAGRELDGALIKVNVARFDVHPPYNNNSGNGGPGGPGRMRGRPGFFPGRGAPFRPPPPGPGRGNGCIDRRGSDPAAPDRYSPGRYSPRSRSLSPDRRGRKRRHASLSKSPSRSRSRTRSPTASRSRSPRRRSPSSSPSPSRSRTRSPSQQRYFASPAPASDPPRAEAAGGSAAAATTTSAPPPVSSAAQQQPSVPSTAAPPAPPPSTASPPAAPATGGAAPASGGGGASADHTPPAAVPTRAPLTAGAPAPAAVPAAPASGGTLPAVPGAKPTPSAEAVKKELLRLRKREQELGGRVRSLQDELARRERQLAQRDRDLAEAQLQLRSLQPQVDRYRQWVADLLEGTTKLAASRGAVAAAEAEAARREGALAALQQDILADAQRSGLELPTLGDPGLQEYDDAAWAQLAATIQETERAAEEAAGERGGEHGAPRAAGQGREPTPEEQLQVAMQEAAMEEDA
ncbi:50S ribosomal L28 [Micractinium conductrix]|uniref:Large ribosomal subunit protein bL28c n=1 Tax=Micractinium conductrix TaxID=554055 RepID=A0A2P6VEE6_9CHLO|nr:50S ribosomal L28 [Micractinium conductrix]|eukprot:PSC72464.1 50S ribosomal L28 [Micractinium conductrix]